MFECTTLLINPPFTDFLSIGVRAVLPELTILVVTLPRANLRSAIKGARLKRLSVFAPPLPITVQIAIDVFAGGLQTSALVVKSPFSMALAILEATFARKAAISEKLLMW